MSTAHSAFEDVMAICIGTLLISFGIALFKDAGLLTGGTAGMAFLVHYQTGLPFGWVFSCINLPFYILSVQRMGWVFTGKTFAAVSLLSMFSMCAWLFCQFWLTQPVLQRSRGRLDDWDGVYRVVSPSCQFRGC